MFKLILLSVVFFLLDLLFTDVKHLIFKFFSLWQ